MPESNRPCWSAPGVSLYHGDAVSCLHRLPARSAHCVVTSPPYWQLRNYGSEVGQLGLEKAADCLGWATGRKCSSCYVCHMVGVFAEVRRVLRNDGTLWLNLGDKQDGEQYLIPSRVALALQADGWWLSQDIIWYATNKMPEPVTRRCVRSHEHFLFLAKRSDYYYDAVAVEEENGSNKRDVWVSPVSRRVGTHQATFSNSLIVPCILAGTSEHGCCAECGAPYTRVVARVGGSTGREQVSGTRDRSFGWSRNGGSGSTLDGTPAIRETVGWRRGCSCTTSDVVPPTVLDPFVGSGTTAVAATKLRRRCIGIDLSEEYLNSAAARIEAALAKKTKKSMTTIIKEDSPPAPEVLR